MTDFYELQKTVSENIQRNRIRLGLSSYALGKMLGHNSSGGVYQWEIGKCLPGAYSLCVLADIFECSVDELLGRLK